MKVSAQRKAGHSCMATCINLIYLKSILKLHIFSSTNQKLTDATITSTKNNNSTYTHTNMYLKYTGIFSERDAITMHLGTLATASTKSMNWQEGLQISAIRYCIVTKIERVISCQAVFIPCRLCYSRLYI